MSFIKRAASFGITVALLVAPVIVYLNRQNLYDWWRLRGYSAPTEVVELATQTTMDKQATKIFYVARPQLQARADFQASCTVNEQTIVLGCYRSRVGIFVYNVTDSRLQGVEQVTAAHEMLHAAYERLNAKQRAHVDELTEAAYANLHDDRITKNIDAYRSRDPSVVPNELHSILGTEVRTLPKELEDYYKQYFIDRQKIVGFSEQYEGEFTSRENAVVQYDAQLKSLKAAIDASNASLEAQGKAIDSDSSQLQALLNAKNISAYNSGIPHYQTLVNAYNSDLAVLKKNINQYNNIVEKRNAIATEEQQLLNAIDTRVPATR